MTRRYATSPEGFRYRRLPNANGYLYLDLPVDHWLIPSLGLTPSGYVRTRISEHRYLMAVKLGRPLKPTESVHHKDGNRWNNADTNLELWIKTQPAGFRASDYHCPGCACAI